MSNVDVIRESALAGRVVINEESPRDGAQGKTMMSADFRVRLAREQGAIFGSDGPRHVVFAAGFPSVCRQEFEATRRVAMEAQESVSPAAVCRGIASDVKLALDAVGGARHARILVVVPSSEIMANVMHHSGAREALTTGLDLVREAVDLAGDDVCVDVGLADAPRGDAAMIGEFSGAMTEAGASTINLGDSIGDLLPDETRALYRKVIANAGPETVFASHLHNDLGLALANTLVAMECGVRISATSWLGVAERSGLAPTEQLLFVLAYHPERTAQLLGNAQDPWWTAPDLTRLPRIARMVSEETGVPLIVTTPVVGTGVGTISTGTPFVKPESFQPYDPRILGLEHDVLLTHLASSRVVSSVASSLGHELSRAEAVRATTWVKDRAYRLNQAVIPREDFITYLDGMAAARASVAEGANA